MPLYKISYKDTELSYENGFVLASIPRGLGFDRDISTAATVNDGSSFIKAKVPERQIILSLKAFDHADRERINALFLADDNQAVLTYTPLDNAFEPRKLYCYVDAVSPLSSAFPCVVQVTLIATNPFWQSEKSENFGIVGEIDNFSFDVALPESDTFVFSTEIAGNSNYVINNGNIASGFVMRILLSFPKNWVKITNYTTGKYIRIDGDYQAGCEIVIDTRINSKSVKYRVLGNADYVDILSDLQFGSEFFNVIPGENRIYIDTDSAVTGMDVSVQLNTLFGGV